MLHVAVQCEDADIAATLQRTLTAGGCMIVEDAAFLVQVDHNTVTLCHHGAAVHNASMPIRLHHYITLLHTIMMQRSNAMLRCNDDWTLNNTRRQLIRADESAICELTDKESAIIAALASSDDGITKEALEQAIWAHHPDVTSTSLDTHIYRLRQKLHALDNAPIITIDEGVIILQ